MASDIKITLELDGSSYRGELKKIESDTEQSLNKIKNNVDSVKTAFKELEGNLNSLSSTLAGVGFGAFIINALSAGNSASQAAEKFGITTQAMMEINAAAGSSGVNTNQLSSALARMGVNAERAADQGGLLRSQFDKLGATNEYMRTHSMDEVFAKMVHSLTEIKDPAERARIEMEIFGKSFANIDIFKLDRELQAHKGTMGETAQAAEDAERMYENLKNAFTAVQMEVLKLLDPIVKLIGDKDHGFTGASVAAKLVVDAFALWAGLKTAEMIIGIVDACLALKTALFGVAGAEAAATGGLSTLSSIAIKLGVGALAAVGIAVATDQITLSTDKATDATKKNTEANEKNKESLKNKPQPLIQNGNLNPGAAAEQSLKNQYAQLQLNNKLALDRLDLETQLVGRSESFRTSKLAEFDAESNFQRKQLELQGQIAKLRAEQANTRGGGNFGGQIKILTDELKTYESQADAVKAKTKALTDARVQEEITLKIGEAEKKMRVELANLQDEYNQFGMTADEKKLEALKKQYNQALEVVKISLQSKYGSDYDIEGTDEFTQAQKELGNQLDKNRAQMQKNIDQSRDFSLAWTGAVKQYQDDAYNGAKVADEAFKSFSQNTESYFLSLATGGKMTFADFTNAVITDIIKMEIKAMTSSLFSSFTKSAGGSGGLLESIGNFFSGGHAMGGSIPSGQFGLVGEQGPELIKGPATVLTNNATADAMGGGTAIHNYNIQAVDAKSVAQLFAENRMTMFGMVEQARRELPMRTR